RRHTRFSRDWSSDVCSSDLLPFVHYRWEFAEMVQALIMFVVSLAMIPLLEKYLGVPYDVALAYVVVCGIGFMLPALLGVPLVPGWITPGIPVVLLFLSDYEPGPEAIQALFRSEERRVGKEWTLW